MFIVFLNPSVAALVLYARELFPSRPEASQRLLKLRFKETLTPFWGLHPTCNEFQDEIHVTSHRLTAATIAAATAAASHHESGMRALALCRRHYS